MAERSALVLYVTYRKTQGKPLLKRVVVPERALRGERRDAEYGSILVPILGALARRRHRPDGGAPGGRGGRRVLRGRPRRDDRGALGLRGADVAADRRARCPTSSSSAPGRRWRGRRRWGRSTRASRSRPRPCAPAAPAQAIVDEARRRGVQAIVMARRGALEDPRRRAARRPRRPARQLRGGGHEVRHRQGALPGHPHRAAGGDRERRRAAAPTPPATADARARRSSGAARRRTARDPSLTPLTRVRPRCRSS